MWIELTNDQQETKAQSGCVTLLHFIRDKPVSELEKVLGFNTGALKVGAYIWRFDEMPMEIESWGSTRTSLSMFGATNPSPEQRNLHYGYSDRVFDHAVGNLRRAFTREGDMSLVKVIPIGKPEDYPNAPIGSSVPQFIVHRSAKATRLFRVVGA